MASSDVTCEAWHALAQACGRVVRNAFPLLPWFHCPLELNSLGRRNGTSGCMCQLGRVRGVRLGEEGRAVHLRAATERVSENPNEQRGGEKGWGMRVHTSISTLA